MKRVITLTKPNTPSKVKVWVANTNTQEDFIDDAKEFHQLFIEEGGDITIATHEECRTLQIIV